MKDIESMTEEEVSKLYEDEVSKDSYEKHSCLTWCSNLENCFNLSP